MRTLPDEHPEDFEPNKVLNIKCKRCKTEHELEVKASEYENWRSGELIQRAMPNLTADQRELLISGICGDCFDEMFPEEFKQ